MTLPDNQGKTTANDYGLKVDEAELSRIPLTRINCQFGMVKKQDADTKSILDMVKSQRKSTGAETTVIFAVRTPGCGMCREHGLQLAEWATQYASTSKKNPTVTLVGVVKESGTALTDQVLLDFYENYFHHALYEDSKWKIFRAFGGRKLTVWKFLTTYRRNIRRWNSKKISVPAKKEGELLMEGGVLVFDRHGALRHALHDNFSELYDTQALDKVVQEIHKETLQTRLSKHSSRSSTTSDVTESTAFSQEIATM